MIEPYAHIYLPFSVGFGSKRTKKEDTRTYEGFDFLPRLDFLPFILELKGFSPFFPPRRGGVVVDSRGRMPLPHMRVNLLRLYVRWPQ